MVVKVYISGISGNKEVKKRQQRVLMILDSKNIKYEIIDITEPGREDDKEFMQNKSKSNGATVSDPNPRTPLPPQIFNDDEYCGDYDQFDLANEVDTLEQFVKVEAPPEVSPPDTAINGDVQTNDVEIKLTENSQDSNGTVENTNEANEIPNDSNEIVSKEEIVKEDSIEKETSLPQVGKESSPVRQKSVEKDEETDTNKVKPADETEIVLKEISEDNTPAPDETVNENGTVSSREQSEEKEQTEQKTDNPSEDLIKSEQAASAE